MPKKMKPLSTASEQIRYLISSLRSALAAAMLLVLLAGGTAQGAEEPLSPDFLDYLATVEESGIKWPESLSLEEIYQMLRKVVQHPADSGKKESSTNGRDEHGENPRK